jgi:hypothetical protein
MTHEEIKTDLLKSIQRSKPKAVNAYWPKKFQNDVEQILVGKQYQIIHDINQPFGSTHFRLIIDTDQFETIDKNH